MWTADKWRDYELCDASDGERLEKWNGYVLRRPDPQVIWKTKKTAKLWFIQIFLMVIMCLYCRLI